MCKINVHKYVHALADFMRIISVFICCGMSCSFVLGLTRNTVQQTYTKSVFEPELFFVSSQHNRTQQSVMDSSQNKLERP